MVEKNPRHRKALYLFLDEKLKNVNFSQNVITELQHLYIVLLIYNFVQKLHTHLIYGISFSFL